MKRAFAVGGLLCSGVLLSALLLISDGSSDRGDDPIAAVADPTSYELRMALFHQIEQQMSQGQSWEGDTPFILPGIDQPPTVPADAAEIGDEMEVIGVTCNGRHRAYLISALSAVRSHVVNDVLGDQALTVTFCNRTDHSRCVGGDGAVPLDLSLGGWRGGKMLLKVGDSFFSHDDEQLPYSDVPFERTTWKAWREAHPETDVYMAPPEPGQG